MEHIYTLNLKQIYHGSHIKLFPKNVIKNRHLTQKIFLKSIFKMFQHSF